MSPAPHEPRSVRWLRSVAVFLLVLDIILGVYAVLENM